MPALSNHNDEELACDKKFNHNFVIFEFVIAYMSYLSNSWQDPFNTVIGAARPDLSLSALAEFQKQQDDSEAMTTEL